MPESPFGISSRAKALGELTRRLVENWERWTLRRVETVRFLSAQALVRSVTLDVDMTAVLARVPKAFDDPQIPVPVAVLAKDLFVDFSIRGETGERLPLSTREEDSYAAWAWVVNVASKSGFDIETFGESLHRQIYRVAHGFDEEPLTTLPEDWSDDDHVMWKAILQKDEIARLLKVVATNFLPICRLKREEGIRVLSFEFREPWKFTPTFAAGFGLEPVPLDVLVSSFGRSRSYHLRVDVPADTQLVRAQLVGQSGTDGSVAQDYPKIPHRVRLTQTRACFYFSRIPVVDETIEARVDIRLPAAGFIRGVWLATLIGVVLTWLSGRFWAQIASEKDAAVAFLITVPLFVQGYLVRPASHPIPLAVRRRTRLYLGAGSFVATFIAAGHVLVARAEISWLSVTLGSYTGVSCVIASMTLWKTRGDLRRNDEFDRTRLVPDRERVASAPR